jgi:hypothetical protein
MATASRPRLVRRLLGALDMMFARSPAVTVTRAREAHAAASRIERGRDRRPRDRSILAIAVLLVLYAAALIQFAAIAAKLGATAWVGKS